MRHDGKSIVKKMVRAFREGRFPYDLRPYLDALNRATFPLVAGNHVLFVFPYRGRAAHVAGDMNGWYPRYDRLRKVRGTFLHVLERHYPAGSRLDYKFVTRKGWFLDPLNPVIAPSGFGDNSELRMGEYRLPEELRGPSSHRTRGQNFGIHVRSRAYRAERFVRVHLPKAYEHDSARRFPVIYILDGEEYYHLARAGEILDFAVERGLLPPAILVCAPPGHRMREYGRSLRLRRFLGEDLIPEIDGRFRTIPAREHRVLVGASMSGLAALDFALARPDLSGRVLAQSPSFWYSPSLEREIERAAHLPGRVAIDAGVFEGIGDDYHLYRIRSVAQALGNRGVEVLYQEVPEGHSWGSWRARLLGTWQKLLAA